MKKIEAVIRPEKLEPVRGALAEMGVMGMTVTEVSGRGREKGIILQWRAGEYTVELLPRVKVEVVVLDEDLGRALNAIVRKSRTGERGDGKIFIIPVENVVRVRTGEIGENAI